MVARRPLYPVTPGETAIDRLLNQTLPNILKEERARQEREELREQENARYAAEFKYRVDRDTKIDSDNFKKQNTSYGLSITEALNKNDYSTARALQLARETHYNDNPDFVDEGMKSFSLKQDNLIKNGETIRDNFLRNTEIIRSDASAEAKLEAFTYNEENIDKVNQNFAGKFRDSISRTGDPSLRYIQNETAILDLVKGFGTDFNTLAATALKMDTEGFESLSEKEMESLVQQLSPEDQKEYGFPSQDPVKNQVRKQKLEAVYKQNQNALFNQTGNQVLDLTITSFNGVDGYKQVIQNLREQGLEQIEDIMLEKLTKTVDFATRGKADRIAADVDGTTGQYVQEQLRAKGFDVDYLFDSTPVKDKTTVIPGKFTDKFSSLSDREIVKLITDPTKDDAFLGIEEQYLIQQNKRLDEINDSAKDRDLTTAEKNERQKIREELRPFNSELNLLTNQKYLDRRAAGKPARTLKGKLGRADVKGALKLVENVEALEEGKNLLENALESARIIPERPFGEGYVIGEKLQLTADELASYKKTYQLLYGKRKSFTTKAVDRDEVVKIIKALDKRILKIDEKISKDVIGIKDAYNLLSGYTLSEIINVAEDGSRDISYKLLRK